MDHSSVTNLKQNGQTSGLNSRRGTRTPRRGFGGPKFLAIGVALVIWFPLAAVAAVNEPAIAAAMGLWGYITGVDIQIAKCREIDPANAASYDLAYGIYHQEVGALLLRIDILLNAEVARAGAPKDFITARQRPILEGLGREAQRAVDTNPAMWLAACRDLPEATTKRIYEFGALRERYPDWMRLIDEWR